MSRITTELERHAAGEITLEQLAEFLITFSYAKPLKPNRYGEGDPGPYPRDGTWDEVTHAEITGLLSVDDARALGALIDQRFGRFATGKS